MVFVELLISATASGSLWFVKVWGIPRISWLVKNENLLVGRVWENDRWFCGEFRLWLLCGQSDNAWWSTWEVPGSHISDSEFRERKWILNSPAWHFVDLSYISLLLLWTHHCWYNLIVKSNWQRIVEEKQTFSNQFTVYRMCCKSYQECESMSVIALLSRKTRLNMTEPVS